MRCRTCEGATAAQDELVVPMNSLQCVPRQIHSEIPGLGYRPDLIPAALHMHARIRGKNELRRKIRRGHCQFILTRRQQ